MKNAYETGSQKIIPAVLLYAFYQGEVLMLCGRSKDGLPGKWNGLGGKLEQGESMLDAAVREFQEEASCQTTADQWHWMGQLYFPNFKSQKNEDWWVNVYLIDLSLEQKNSIPVNDDSQPEGALHFMSPEQAMNLDLWEGDLHFLPLVFKRTPFEGTFFYQNGRCEQFTVKEIGTSPL